MAVAGHVGCNSVMGVLVTSWFCSSQLLRQLNEGSGTNRLPFPAPQVHGGAYFYISMSCLDAATTSPSLGLQHSECFHPLTSCCTLLCLCLVTAGPDHLHSLVSSLRW